MSYVESYDPSSYVESYDPSSYTPEVYIDVSTIPTTALNAGGCITVNNPKYAFGMSNMAIKIYSPENFLD